MIKALLAVASAILVAVAAQCENVFIFNDSLKTVEYYLFSAGSDCVIASESDLSGDPLKILSIKGSAARRVESDYIADLLKRTSSRKVMEESVGSVTSKYYYSDKIRGYKLVNGKKVNIHVVFDGESYSVGTPIIFGAY